MTLATRCPKCKTAFRVTSLQLSVANGDVRCGKCNRVFNAKVHLLVQEVAPLTVTADANRPTTQTDLSAIQKAVFQPKAPKIHDSTPTNSPSAARRLMTLPASLGTLAEQKGPEPNRRIVEHFSWAKRTAAQRSKPKGSTALSAALAALAFLQAFWWFPETWYAQLPATRPLLEALSTHLMARSPLPRVASALIVDHVVLEASEDPQQLTWSFELRNTADYPIALPALELTLTDAKDHPLLRKIFQPADYHTASNSPMEALPAHGNLFIQQELHTTGVEAQGYQVAAFYP